MKRVKVIVCGTSFGRFYLAGLARHTGIELAGILSTGSTASAKLAQSYGIPHLSSPEEVPNDVDMACVVVRAGVSGGAGSDVSRALLNRGIHVLQEHPLHPSELAACLREASRHKVTYAVNSFYPFVAPIKQFLAAAAVISSRQKPLFIDGMCGAQVFYPLLDIAARSSGGISPSSLQVSGSHSGPYTCLNGQIAGVDCHLRVQNQIHPADADNHALLLHRLAVVYEAGVLTLADTHGPVIWSPRLHTHRDSTHRLVLDGPGTERLDVLSSEVLSGTEPATFRCVFQQFWPDAVNRAVDAFIASWGVPQTQRQTAQWTVALTAFWHQVSTDLGPPEHIHPDAPRQLALPHLLQTEVA